MISMENHENFMVSELLKRYNVSSNEVLSITLEMHKKNIENLIKTGVHTAKITAPKSKGGMWCTYVYDDAKPNNRRCIQGRTEHGFYKSLYTWYYPDGDKYKKSSITNLLDNIS